MGETGQQAQEQQAEQEKFLDLNEPKTDEFNIPESEKEIEQLIEKVMEYEMSNADATTNIDRRKNSLLNCRKSTKLKRTRRARKDLCPCLPLKVCL
jgi:uncharacterized protein YecA (UPF0149 family)